MPETMSYLNIHVSPPALRTHHAEASASMTTDGGPSHHAYSTPAAGSDAHDDDAWLASELAPCSLGDWLDMETGDESSGDSSALPWCVPAYPTPVLAFPQSPTSVDYSSVTATTAAVPSPETMSKLYFDPFELCDREQADLTSTETDVKHKALDVKVEIDHEWMSDGARQELRRRRQRAYESKYRKKKHRTFKALQDEWARKEMELYVLMKEKARPFRVDQPRASLAQLVQEESAARVDQLMLTSLTKLQTMFELRNYSDDEIMRSRETWAKIDRAVLGPGVIKPFCPFRHEFQW